MKKVFLSLAFVAAMSVSFVSCKETKTEETTEVTAPAEEAPATEEVAPATPDTTAVAPATEAPATETAPATEAKK